MQDAVKVCSADPPFYTSHTTLESADYSWGHLGFFLSIVRLYDSAVERENPDVLTGVLTVWVCLSTLIRVFTTKKEILSASTSLPDI